MKMDKYGNELKLILLLTDNNSYTAMQIAEKLGITRRNLYYYFDYLKDCGFILIKNGTCYRLDRNTSFFKKLHENIALNDDEATFIYQMLDNADKNDYNASSLKSKLQRQFNLDGLNNPTLVKQAHRNIQKLKEAIRQNKIVTLKDYSSPHSKTVIDRMVEPFLLMNRELDVRCYELKSHMNKTFKISRIKDVEFTDVTWLHKKEHKEVYTDIFMFSGEERHHIKIRLGQLSHNLIIEEYPNAEPMIRPEDDNHWILETDVVSYLGITRFVIGLFEDIEVIGDEEFRLYLEQKITAIQNKMQK